jgi:hypothetical protein
MRVGAFSIACALLSLSCETAMVGTPGGQPSATTEPQVSALVAPFARALRQMPRDSAAASVENVGLFLRTTGANRKLRAHLPLRGDLPLIVERTDRDFGVEVRPEGAHPTLAKSEGSFVRLAKGGPGGTDMLLSALHDAVEDWVLVTDPEQRELRYTLDVRRVPGLRLVGRTLEFLDARGSPQLHVSPPALRDHSGAQRSAKLALEGCAYDTSPRLPWGRPITPPRATRCSLIVSWDNQGLYYPVVVDPFWSLGEDMGEPRFAHTAILVPGDSNEGTPDRVCVIGGKTDSAHVTDGAECLDTATRQWAAVQPLQQKRWRHTATRLLNNQVLVVGGEDDPEVFGEPNPLSSTEIFDPATGQFQPGPSLPLLPRTLHTATRLNSGSVVVLGGGSPYPLTLETPQEGVTQWLKGTQAMPGGARFGHAAAFAEGRIFIFGGSLTPDLLQPLPDVASYDTRKGEEKWSVERPMLDESNAPSPKTGHTATLLPAVESAPNAQKELILVAGGTRIAHLFDPHDGSFLPLGKQPGWLRRNHAAVQMQSSNGDSFVVLIGGAQSQVNATPPYARGEVFWRANNGWNELDIMLNKAREDHSATLLSDQHTVVAIGGRRASIPIASAEQLTMAEPGAECSADSNCVVGVCSVQKVCCNDVCEGECASCDTGTCSVKKAGSSCGGPPSACQGQAACDGKSQECPAPPELEAGTACGPGDAGVCSAGRCVSGEAGAAGEGGSSAETAGAGPALAGSGGVGNAPPVASDQPAIHWSCQTSAPGHGQNALFLLLLSASLAHSRRRRCGARS